MINKKINKLIFEDYNLNSLKTHKKRKKTIKIYLKYH